jgi:hypothetical protein
MINIIILIYVLLFYFYTLEILTNVIYYITLKHDIILKS